MKTTMSLYRARVGRLLAAAGLAGVMAGCGASDRLTSVGDPRGANGLPEAASTPPSFASTSLPGIPFGTWALPTEAFSDVYTGAMRVIDPNLLLKELAAIKARGGRVVLMFAGNEENFKDHGHFSLSMWKSRVDRFKGVDFSSYLDDGTVIGHYLIDEPNDPANWSGAPVSGAVLDEMAAYSKQLWPKLPTVVRVDPSYLARSNVQYKALDAAWSQYVVRKGDPAKYLRDQVTIAQNLGLALITGLNIRKGGPKQSQLDASVVLNAGSALLANDYPCAFLSWEYDPRYLSRVDITQAMQSLSQQARQHPSRSCAGTGRAGPPPPPPPPGNQLPVASFNAPSCTVGQACSFDDRSTDADGKIAGWAWNFGDGSTATDAKPQHTYSSAGSYTVTLQVTDDAGGSKSVSASVAVAPRPNQPPSAGFTPPSCTAGVPCQFQDGSADSDGSIASRSWTFGDGSTSSDLNPAHTFAAANSYTVTLTVTDDKGVTATVSSNVTVSAAPNGSPTAAFTPPACVAGTPCQFSDGSSDADGNVVTRAWSFPNGATGSGPNAQTTFASPGTYSVTLSVTDDDGATSSVSHDVVVGPATLPGGQPIVLSLRLSTDNGQQRVRLTWRGAAGAKVDLYRNGSLREKILNDGTYIRTTASSIYQYQVCETGSARCSNIVATSSSAPPPASITLAASAETSGKPRVVLSWSGIRGSNVDMYRDGNYFKTVANDGGHINSRGIQLGSTYTFKVCEHGGSTCSNSVSVRVQ